MTSAAERPVADPGHATAARYEDGCLLLTLSTGRVVREPIDRYAWLASASPGARARVEVVDFGTVIRWPELDEDLGVATILGVSEEVVARSAGFKVGSRRPTVEPQPASASLNSSSPSRA